MASGALVGPLITLASPSCASPVPTCGIGQQGRTSRFEACQHDLAVLWPVEDVQIDLARLGRAAAPVHALDRPRRRAVDGLAVDVQPAPIAQSAPRWAGG